MSTVAARRAARPARAAALRAVSTWTPTRGRPRPRPRRHLGRAGRLSRTGPISDDERRSAAAASAATHAPGRHPVRARTARTRAPGSPRFDAAFPNGLPPRSPVFCRELTALLALVGSAPDAIAARATHFSGTAGWARPGPTTTTTASPTWSTTARRSRTRRRATTTRTASGDACDNCVDVPQPAGRGRLPGREPVGHAHGRAARRRPRRLREPVRRGLHRSGAPRRWPGPGPAPRAASAGAAATDDVRHVGRQPCAIFDLDETGDTDRRRRT